MLKFCRIWNGLFHNLSKYDLEFFVDVFKMYLKIISYNLDKIFIVFKTFNSDEEFTINRISKERIRVDFYISNIINLQVYVDENNTDC